jgi:phage shock protein PspC (stress-responsive transcriptional regulator)
MCWNASVSLNTFVFGVFASLFSYFNGDTKILGVIFYLSIIIMQLIEYFIWSKTFSNRLLSQIALLVILLQPIFNILNIEEKPELIPYLLLAYITFIIILYTIIIPLNTVDFSSVPGKNGHLAWNWLNFNLLIIFIWFMFLSSRWIIDKMYLYIVLFTIFLIISMILYKDTQTWGSMWCWACNFSSFYFILSVFYKDFCTVS